MMKKIMVMAGGTGGHIFPGIAIGKACLVKNPDMEILWLGSFNHMEMNIIPEQTSFQLFLLNISGFRKKSFLKKCALPFYLLYSIIQALKILNKEKPDAVIGMGGFVCGPGALAAKLLNIPIYLHEQNSIPGMTNKILSKMAKKVFCGFPDAFKKKISPSDARLDNKYIFTGNPIRKDILDLPAKTQLHQPIRVLIVGGSRGAQIFNEIMPQSITFIPNNFELDVVHQTGEQSHANYSSNIPHISIQTTDFISDMAQLYNWADIIICRAGALTLAEITAVGIPAILIPYPYAVDDHQTKNAEYLVKNHAAYLLKQSELTPEKISDHLVSLFDEKKYLEMANASRALRCDKAVEIILEHLI